MKRNGFTLIELLAVIVILAIIALIATPIILGIIKDSREKANERSIELYVSAVKNAVMAYRLTNSKAAKNFEDLTIEYDGEVECLTQELYSNGSFFLDKCKVNGGEKEYSYGKDLNPPKCTVKKQDISKYSVGDIVTCELSESIDKFYVIEEQQLSTPEIKVLTEKNIHRTEYRQSDNSKEDYFQFSNHSYWTENYYTNLLPQYGNSYPAYVYDNNSLAYSVVENYMNYLNDNWAKDGTASLLAYDQIINLGCSFDNRTCLGAPDWLYSTRYWLGTAEDESYMFIVYSNGVFTDGGYDGLDDGYAGVRPVITIPTRNIK